MIVANTYEFFLFGRPILKGYYVTFNMKESTISFIPQVNSEKPLFGEKQSVPLPSYVDKEKPDLAKQSIPLVWLILSIAVFQFYVRPKLLVIIPVQITRYGVEVFFAAIIIIVYSILVPLTGGPILTKDNILDTLSSILGF